MPSLWLYALLTVLLESHPPDPALLGVALQSCTEALSHASCLESGAASEPADFVARLTWRDELHARVEVSPRGAPSAAPREITFSEADSPRERYRALGLVVASYVLAQRPAETVAQPAVPQGARRPRFGLDLALLGGPALDRGRYRVGGLVRAHVRPFQRLPALSFLLGARGSQRMGAPSLTWLGLSFGLAGQLALRDWLAAEARLEWVSQRFLARAVAADSGARDRGDRYRHGGQLGLELLVRATPHLSPFLGADLALLRPRVRVLVAGREVGEERALEATLLLGIRFGW